MYSPLSTQFWLKCCKLKNYTTSSGALYITSTTKKLYFCDFIVFTIKHLAVKKWRVKIHPLNLIFAKSHV